MSDSKMTDPVPVTDPQLWIPAIFFPSLSLIGLWWHLPSWWVLLTMWMGGLYAEMYWNTKAAHMTDPTAVPDLLSRIDEWQDDHRYSEQSYYAAEELLDACRIVLGQQQAQIEELTQPQVSAADVPRPHADKEPTRFDAREAACPFDNSPQEDARRSWATSPPPLTMENLELQRRQRADAQTMEAQNTHELLMDAEQWGLPSCGACMHPWVFHDSRGYCDKCHCVQGPTQSQKAAYVPALCRQIKELEQARASERAKADADRRSLLAQRDEQAQSAALWYGQLEVSATTIAHLEDQVRSLLAERDALAQEVEELKYFVNRCKELGATDTDIVKHALEDSKRLREEGVKAWQLENELGDAQRQITALREQLNKRGHLPPTGCAGWHLVRCGDSEHRIETWVMDPTKCTCGLADILSGEARP